MANGKDEATWQDWGSGKHPPDEELWAFAIEMQRRREDAAILTGNGQTHSSSDRSPLDE